MNDWTCGRDAARSLQTKAAPDANGEGFALRQDVNTRDPYTRGLVETVSDAMAWREANPRCWGFIVSRCRELTAGGRHFPFRMVMEEARYYAAPVGDGGLFKLPNDYAPILQRMACAEVPGMARLVDARRSKYDGVIA